MKHQIELLHNQGDWKTLRINLTSTNSSRPAFPLWTDKLVWEVGPEVGGLQHTPQLPRTFPLRPDSTSVLAKYSELREKGTLTINCHFVSDATEPKRNKQVTAYKEHSS